MYWSMSSIHSHRLSWPYSLRHISSLRLNCSVLYWMLLEKRLIESFGRLVQLRLRCLGRWICILRWACCIYSGIGRVILSFLRRSSLVCWFIRSRRSSCFSLRYKSRRNRTLRLCRLRRCYFELLFLDSEGFYILSRLEKSFYPDFLRL